VDYELSSDRDNTTNYNSTLSQPLRYKTSVINNTKDYGVSESVEPLFNQSPSSLLLRKHSTSSTNEGPEQSHSMKILLSDINDMIGSLEYEAIGL